MVRRSGQQGVPVIAVGDQYIVGFDQPRLEQALAAANPPERPRFGASIADVAAARVRAAGLPDAGAYVGRVTAGSPAQRAGLAAGDVIIEIAGRRVQGATDVESALSNLTPGAAVALSFVRRGEHRRGEARLP